MLECFVKFNICGILLEVSFAHDMICFHQLCRAQENVARQNYNWTLIFVNFLSLPRTEHQFLLILFIPCLWALSPSPVSFLCSEWLNHPAPQESPVVLYQQKQIMRERAPLAEGLSRSPMRSVGISATHPPLQNAHSRVKHHSKHVNKALTGVSKAQS